MEDSLFWGIPKSAYESADRMLILARKGRNPPAPAGRYVPVPQARLRIRAWMNTAIFCRPKLCCEILQLEGADMSAQDETASDGLAGRAGRENNACRLLQGGTEREKCPDGQRNEFYRKHVFEL